MAKKKKDTMVGADVSVGKGFTPPPIVPPSIALALGIPTNPKPKETDDQIIKRLESQGYGAPSMAPIPPVLADRMTPIEQAKYRLEQVKRTGAENLESAAASAMTAGKGIDKIAERQMGLTPGQALPVKAGFDVNLPSDFFSTTPPPPPTVSPALPAVPSGGGPALPTVNKVSAYDKLKERLAARNLSSLYAAVKDLVEADLPESEFTMQLRATPAYQKRFAANERRIQKGYTPIGEADYLRMEDRYQNVMRLKGLPESYWARSGFGEQINFEKLIENDVSEDELLGRIDAAQTVVDSNPGVLQSLKTYYPEISNGDVLGYVLDPKNAARDIERKVRAAQIGGAALTAGLGTAEKPTVSLGRATEIMNAGISAEQAQQGYKNIADILPTAQKLSSIYDGGGYTQAEAEAEAFGLAGGVQAGTKRKKLASQERAAFSGQSGLAGTALERGRSGAF